jgi:hypothetical protein
MAILTNDEIATVCGETAGSPLHLAASSSKLWNSSVKWTVLRSNPTLRKQQAASKRIPDDNK